MREGRKLSAGAGSLTFEFLAGARRLERQAASSDAGFFHPRRRSRRRRLSRAPPPGPMGTWRRLPYV